VTKSNLHPGAERPAPYYLLPYTDLQRHLDEAHEIRQRIAARALPVLTCPDNLRWQGQIARAAADAVKAGRPLPIHPTAASALHGSYPEIKHLVDLTCSAWYVKPASLHLLSYGIYKGLVLPRVLVEEYSKPGASLKALQWKLAQFAWPSYAIVFTPTPQGIVRSIVMNPPSLSMLKACDLEAVQRMYRRADMWDCEPGGLMAISPELYAHFQSASPAHVLLGETLRLHAEVPEGSHVG